MKIKLKKSQKKAAIRIAVSVLLLIGAVIADKLLFNMEERPPFPQYLFRILIYLPAYLACGYKTIISAFSGIIHGQWFDENFLMTLSSGCAIGLGECLEGCAVMILSCVGNLFESCAVSNARESLEELARLCPDSVKLCEDPSGSDYRVIPAKDAKIGDCFRVDAGDRIALDGTVIEGVSSVDCSSMTGEFLPVEVGPGSGVMSGTVNKDGKLIIRATKTADSSSAAKVVAMVESAGAKKTATESFITKFAMRYTPTVVILALIVAFAFPFITGDRDFTKWIYRALTFLVISCPCALVISIPLVFFGTIGNGAKKGILYKDNSKIETISKLKSVAFDKTGTLTKGKPYVSGIEVFRDINENELLSLASSVEYGSSHPLAAAIVGFAESNGIPRDHAENVSETAGKGRSGKVAGKTVSVGSRKHVSELTGGVLTESGETAVYVTVDGELHGKISFADEIKNDSAETVGDLRAIGIKTYILSGDSYASANRIGRDVGVDVVKADLLPGDKLNALEEIMNNGKTAYVGDGINDAPALARADVGFAMGSMGADASVDASDVVISGDSPGKVLAAVRTSKKAMRIAYENIIFALAVKIAVMILGVFGLASIWLAVFADVGVSIICIINSLRMNG